MRVVLDTNAIISATLIRGGTEDQIVRAWQRGVFELVLSPPILEEMGRALFYEKLRKFRWMTVEEVEPVCPPLSEEGTSATRGPAIGRSTNACRIARLPSVLNRPRWY